MVNIIPPQTVLTPTGAANELQSEGLDALGLTVPTLSPAWATATPVAASDYDADNLTLNLTGVRAPFRAIRTFVSAPTIWSGADGASLSGPVAVLRLHPEAARRLERLVAVRYGAPVIRPVPVAIIIRGITLPAPVPVPEWYLAGEPLGLGGSLTVSFHDGRGLPIDPIAVAAMFSDLITWRPALRMSQDSAATVADPGGLDGIVSLASGVRCHVIDPHGWAYAPSRELARLKVVDASNVEIAAVANSGLVDLAAGQRLGRSANDEAADSEKPLQWGWATSGTLARTVLVPPDLPAGVNLARQFFRVMAVDLNWHLLGNRSNDDKIPDFALPKVRQSVPNFDYLVDGMDVLGAAAEIATGFPPGGGAGMFALAVSPVITPELAVPPGTGGIGHWPAFPLPNTKTALSAATDPTNGLSGHWRSPADSESADFDVVLTILANAVPDGAYVRIFPRRFVEIQAIGEQPSFVRGDGGAALAVAGTATRILLVDPFGLAPSGTKPNPAKLEVDIVVTSRMGQRRLFSVVAVTLSDPPEVWDVSLAAFDGDALLNTPPLTTLFSSLNTLSIAPVPLFGLPRPVTPPGGTPGSIAALVRQLASEEQPRQGPRLPTQARFETILALGTSVTPDQQLSWKAVLSGARWTWESRVARPDLGNPGNPAGPDVHAAGVRCEGQLAYDLALHALKRAQPILPVSAESLGWLVSSGGDNWDEPGPDSSGTVSAAMLETVAAFCDTPELALPGIPIPQPTDSIQTVVNNLADALGLPAPTFSVANEDELRRKLQREVVTAKFGQRDALWALHRAIGQAREFIYIESPTFARTARPSGTPKPHEVDLVEAIRQQLAANPRLKVMICVPRVPDFAAEKAPWVRAALKHRKDAIQQLITQDRNRVAAFHPIGFPGRPTAIRSTVVIVDDIWCLVGTSHFRRRGMTFDGAVDVVSLDRTMANGYSSGITRFRQELMAAKLGVDVPGSPAVTSAIWTRLAQPEAAFDTLADLLQQGGLGRCSPIWAGPTDTNVIEQSADVVDPDGVDEDGSNLLNLFKTLLLEG
ncbi:hypothetical protein [Leptolyngbya sp. FACHB-261]|uniref:hypothetical protein n=1 Tax=Leptolyngbya sp. FACHB-261 TaxID=2692806 RepID=UPI001681D474|nr:hypothetical protein [Leptolyngbya sp. FACHB-261]MBD2103994.1 hypothetical protein [Leptolyngbya sp. FACHB-261]